MAVKAPEPKASAPRKASGKKPDLVAILAGEKPAPPVQEWDARIRAGIPVEDVKALKEALGVSNEALAPMLGVSRATIVRHRPGQALSIEVGDRVVRYARLFLLAAEVMEGPEAARHWLTSPQFGLGSKVPLDFALTDLGAAEVERLLGRIKHGVYS